MTSPNGQFLALNVGLAERHPNITRIHPGVVRRNHPEPDRSQVEGYVPPKPEPRKEEREPVAARKRTRVKADADTRAVAVARVEKLIEAGNPAGKAIAAVAKELGASESSVTNWRSAAKKQKPAREKGAAKKVTRRSSNGARAGNLAHSAGEFSSAVLGGRLVELLGDAVGPIVRAIVREEIRRMLS